jgi:hypothetical protein
MIRTQLSAILAVCLSSWLKFFSTEKKIIWFGLGGFLLVRKGFSRAARVAYSANMFLKIKTVCLLYVYTRDAQLLNKTLKIFI